MPNVSLHGRLPELAESETRTVTVVPENRWGLPPAAYFPDEMCCDETGCDRRRVFFNVLSTASCRLEPAIADGWEPPRFYPRRFPGAGPMEVADLAGPVLNLGSPQSPLAPTLLRGVQEIVLRDEGHFARLRRHYAAFKETIPTSPGARAAGRGATARAAGRVRGSIRPRGRGERSRSGQGREVEA